MTRADSDSETGFTILEATIASTVLLTVMSSLTMLSVGSFYLSGTSRQQQAASFLANQVIEEVRALPYQTVANGLSDTDPTITTDSNIQVSGTAPDQTLTFLPTHELIPHGQLSYSQVPITPHQTTETYNATTYTVSVYPTVAAGMAGVFRVTAIVTWTNALASGMPDRLSTQTLVYSPGSNCLSSDTHPFAAPCQSSFYATVASGAGSVTITPVSGSGIDAIAGIPLTEAQLLLTQAYSTAQVEQTSEVLGSSVTSGGIIDLSGQPQQTTGDIAASSDADNDPAITATAPQTSSVGQAAQSISYSNGNTLSVSPTTSDTAATTSVTTSGLGQPCYDLIGSPQTNGLPCGSSSVLQAASAMSLSSVVYAGTTPLGQTILASVGSPTGPTSTFVTRSKGTPDSYCPSATGDGCIHAGAIRSVGNVAVAGLPPALTQLAGTPSGWGGSSCDSVNALLQLNGFSDAVAAESGTGATAPWASQTAGNLVYWNGSGCTTVPVTWQSNPGTISIPSVSASAPGLDNGVTVTMSASVTLGASGISSNTPSGCTNPCTALATSSSPVSASIDYTITDGSATLAELQISVDLGTLSASTSWQAASP